MELERRVPMDSDGPAIDRPSLPVFEREDEEFEPKICVDALHSKGSVFIQRCFPADIIELFSNETRRAFSLLNTYPEKCPPQYDFYKKYRNINPVELDTHLGTSLCSILLCLRQSSVLDIVREYFQTDSVVAPMGSLLSRHVEKGYGPVAWHQDGTRLEQTRMLTCWIPLTHCGDSAPSLQVALGKLDRLYPEN